MYLIFLGGIFAEPPRGQVGSFEYGHSTNFSLIHHPENAAVKVMSHTLSMKLVNVFDFQICYLIQLLSHQVSLFPVAMEISCVYLERNNNVNVER